MGFFVIFVMMLKPLHIICLLALLGVGLVGCKKEQEITTLPDSEVLQEFFTIKDISEYDTAYFYINPLKNKLNTIYNTLLVIMT